MNKIQALMAQLEITVYGANPEEQLALRASLGITPENRPLHFVEETSALPEGFFENRNHFLFVYGRSANSFQIWRALGIERERVLFVSEVTQAGQHDIALALLQLWETNILKIFRTELHWARESGALPLIEEYIGTTKEETNERAQLAFALATSLSHDLNQIERIVRLALYYALPALEPWQNVVRSSRRLWCLLALFEQKILLGRIPAESACPQDLSLEILVVESAILAQQFSQGAEKDFRIAFKKFSSGLHFNQRTQLRNSVERCFKHVWKDKNAVA